MLAWLMSLPAILWISFVSVVTILCAARGSRVVSTAIFSVGIALLLGVYPLWSVPLPKDIGLPSAAAVYDVNGRLIGRYDRIKRFIIDTSSLPQHVLDAVIAAEDERFFEHGGVDYRGLLRAIGTNIRERRIVQGGSTITQQYVKNAVLQDPGRTIARKLKELVLAVKLEDRYSKDQILGFYLNTIYFGRGAYGIEAAARTYFDKHARNLSTAEGAYLAGIIKAPEAFQPDRAERAAIERRDQVLKSMENLGYLSKEEVEEAAGLEIGAVAGIDDRAKQVRAAYLMEWLRRDFLEPEFGDCLYTCGLKIHTTIDLNLQRFAEDAVARVLTRPEDPQAALVALTPTGQVRAFVGGRAFHDAVAASGFNFAADMPGRQAGSALKPFTLAAALENGLSTASSFSGGGPLDIHDQACRTGRKPWRVSNYGGASYGSMSLEAATTHSVNTVYAQLAERIGPRSIADTLTAFGFDRGGRRPVPLHCSLALGALDVTPVEMARAYAGLAAGGLLPTITPIRYAEDFRGDCLRSWIDEFEYCAEVEAARPERALPATIAESVNGVLGKVVDEGTALAAGEIPDAVGKTGTGQRNVDAWFVGSAPKLTAAVWVGHPAERNGKLVPQMRACARKDLCRPFRGRDVTGGSVPARIWTVFMREAMAYLAPDPPKQEPEGTPDGAPIPASSPAPTASTERPRPAPSPKPSAAPSRAPSPAPSPSPSPLVVLPSPIPDP